MATTIADPPDTDVSDDDGANPGSRWLTPGPDGSRLRLPVALAVAVIAGLALLAAFPPFDQWWLAPIGVALMAAACHRRRFRAGFGLGMIAGIAFFAPLLSWTSTQVGQVPWIALSVLESLYFGLLGATIAYASKLADRHRNWWPVGLAALWTAQEALRDRTPFGGFPWGRLAFSQADAPTLGFAWLGGAPLVTFVTAGCGGLLFVALWRRPRPLRPALRRGVVFVAVAVLATLAGAVVPTGLTAPDGERVNVAVVQGSVPRLGLDFNEQRRAVLDNHVQATLDLAADVADGKREQPDIVVWPENSSDIDPVANPDAYAQVDTAANAVGVPILLGTLQRDGDRVRNISLVWDPDNGPGFSYVKQHPVPFAEYIPIKPVVRTVAGWLDERMVDGIDRVNGFVPGDKPGVVPVGDQTLSGIICFEIAYDELVRESVTEGAGILAVQTNNATFNDAEARQQMAMVRLRSVEHGRAGLMASTVGVSGFTDASGTVYHETTFDTQAVIETPITVGHGTTPATVVGMVPELLACLLAVGALVVAVRYRRRGNRSPAVTRS